MFKITKLMMMVAMVGTLVVMSTGCGGSGDDDTIANVAGVWDVTFEGETEATTVIQDGHSVSMIDTDADVVSGEIYGTSVTLAMSQMDEGVLVTLEFNLTLDSEDNPQVMTGDVEAIIEGVVIETMPIVCIKQ